MGCSGVIKMSTKSHCHVVWLLFIINGNKGRGNMEESDKNAKVSRRPCGSTCTVPHTTTDKPCYDIHRCNALALYKTATIPKIKRCHFIHSLVHYTGWPKKVNHCH